MILPSKIRSKARYFRSVGSFAQEQPAGSSAWHLERLCPQVLPGLFAEIDIHLFNYSRRELID